MFKEISKDIWKLNVDSNVYLLDFKQPMIIDTGPMQYKKELEEALHKIIDSTKIKIVIFTHLHTDHLGNFDLFSNAEFYASGKEIENFQENPFGTTLDPMIKFKKIELKNISTIKNTLKKYSIEIIESPGHTTGSICLFYKKDKILFSGDTLFFNNNIGRTDLPTSDDEKMSESLDKLTNISYKILAPGHDY